MSKFIKRFLLGFFILIILVLGAAVILPIIYKPKIVAFATEEANKKLNADLSLNNDIGLSLFKSFPDFTLTVDQLKIINKAPFKGDTLVYIKQFEATIDIMSVIKGEKYQVKIVRLDNPVIRLLKLKSGEYNWNIMKPDTAPATASKDTASNFKLALKKLEINHANIIYRDDSSNTLAQVIDMSNTLSGDFTQSVFDLASQTDIASLTASYGGVTYLNRVKTSAKLDLNIDQKNSKYTLKENKLILNALELGWNGSVQMNPDSSMALDLSFKANQTDFKNILSLVPVIYLNNFKDLQASGQFALNGKVKGKYTPKDLPAFDVAMNISNGMFKNNSLPEAVKDVNVDVAISNPGGTADATKINISKAHLTIAGDPIDARMIVTTPVSDPYLDGMIKGKIILEKFRNIIKLEAGTSLAGTVQADVTLKGKVSSTQKSSEYQNFDASGNIQFSGIDYRSKSLPDAVQVSGARLDFSPKEVRLSNMKMMLGKSDISGEGSLYNMLGYLFKKGETLKGDLAISSNYFDTNPWLPKDDGKASSTPDQNAKGGNVALPDHIDFRMKGTFNRMIYTNYDMKNVHGMLHLHDQRIDFENLGLEMLGGVFSANGYYSAIDIKKPEVEFNLKLTGISIPESYKTFNTIQKFAGIANYIIGNMDATINLKTSLGEGMMPLFNSLTSQGRLSINDAAIKDYPVLKMLAEKLKYPALSNLKLSNITPSYEIHDGRLFLKEPLKFAYQKVSAVITGSSGLDKTLDFVMNIDIPSGDVQNQAQSEVNNLLKSSNLTVPIGKSVKVTALIGGTSDNPTIKLSLKDFAANALNDLKNQLKAEADKKIQEAKARANQEIDKAKVQAMQAKDKAQAEAQARVDQERQRVDQERQRQEAALKQKTEEEKNRLKNEGNKRLKDIFK